MSAERKDTDEIAPDQTGAASKTKGADCSAPRVFRCGSATRAAATVDYSAFGVRSVTLAVSL